MAEYSKELSYIKFERYDDTVKLVKDIVRIMEGFNPDSINYHFNFEHDNIKCVTESLEEFVEITYGAKHFKLIALQIIARISQKEKIRVNYLLNFSVSATSKILLSDFERQLENEVCEDECVARNEKQGTKITQGSEAGNTTIIIKGDNNTVATANSSVSQSELKEEIKKGSSIKTYLYNVFEGVSINIVWVGITVAFATIVGIVSKLL